MTPSSKRSALLGAGIVVLIVGLLAAVGLWYSAGQRESDAVRNLARAPGGCDTTLDFEATGEFTIYIETTGRFDDSVAGDCVVEGSYEFEGDALPAVSLSMTSPNGEAVTLANSSGITYSADGFVGQSVRTFSIETPGDHVLRVETPGETDLRLAVAVGRDPADGVAALQLGAAVAAVVALALGVGLILASRRSSAVEQPVATGPMHWPVEPGGWPTAPPGMPVAPAPDGWQPAVGPPSQAPAASPSGQNTPPPAGWPTPPAAPEVAPSGPDSAGGSPSWGPAPSPGVADGSTGDGQRSPWAPPSDTAN